MKRIVAILMCSIIVLSLFACNNNVKDDENNHTNSNTNNETSADDPDQENPAEYGKILDMYRSIIELLPNHSDLKETMDQYCAELGIVDELEKELFIKLFGSTFDFKKLPPYNLSCGYATKDLNGDGVDELVLLNDDYMVIAIFSVVDGKPLLLRNYRTRDSAWIDAKGWIHENGSSGADFSTSAVCKIADGGASMELIAEFGTNGHEWVNDIAHTKYYELINGVRVDITEAEYSALEEQYVRYLGYAECAEATKKYSGLTFIPLYTEAEMAMEMYGKALNNEIKVYETSIEEYHYLKDCKTPYDRIPLCELESLGYVYMDVDGDSQNELIISCGDILVLRYYDGVVYVYPFTFRNMYHLNTDGSYSWNHNGQNFEYGENQLAFDKEKLKSKELWRIVNDGEPNAEYYIDGKQVTHEEILKYLENNQKTRIGFSPLEVSWRNEISCSEAMAIAKKYWEKFDIEKNRYLVTPIVSDWAPDTVYVFAMEWIVMDHYSVIDEIWIDKSTGEPIVPYAPDGK